MDSLPSELFSFIHNLRPLMRVEVFDSFCFLLTGLLVGEAKYGTVRSSVFAPAQYQPQRLSDLFCRHKLSHQAFMAGLARLALQTLYPAGLPQRLFWIADSTTTEKPYAERVSGIYWFHRTKCVLGRMKKLRGHCYLFAAHLYRHGQEQLWASVLCGALLYVKGRTLPELAGDLAQQLRLPPEVHNCWVLDRGLMARPCLRALDKQGQFALSARATQPGGLFQPAPPAQGAWTQANLRREVSRGQTAGALPRAPAAAADKAACAGARAQG